MLKAEESLPFRSQSLPAPAVLTEAKASIYLPLVPAKLADLVRSTALDARQRREYFGRIFFSTFRSDLPKLSILIVLLFLMVSTIDTVCYAETYGWVALLYLPFWLKLLGIYLLVAFGCCFRSLHGFGLAIGNIRPLVIGDLYVSDDGIAFGDSRKIIPWAKIQLVQLKEYQYYCLSPSKVLEIYLDKDTYKKVKSAHLQANNDFVYWDSSSGKFASNEFESVCIRLPLEIFGFQSDCEKFFLALKENLPLGVVHSLPDYVASVEEQVGFTALWLEELHDDSVEKRQRLLEIGQELKNGRYMLTGILGYGGFSVVYAAQDRNERLSIENGYSEVTCVAIKEVLINSGVTRASKERILNQILTEIELLKSLEHPNIVKCLDYFIDGGRVYIVMQALEGRNLRDFVNEFGSFSFSELVTIGRQCSSILSYLHSRKPPLLHRDFAPDNLIWDGHTIKLIDFNVAEEVNTSVSQTVVGKHSYLAPEQWSGRFSEAGDLYQLGCSLYFFATQSDPEPLTQSNPRVLRPDLPETFCALVSRLTERETEKRYASAAEVARDFELMGDS